jgi:hypothetical protein
MKRYSITERDFWYKTDITTVNNMISMAGFSKEEYEAIFVTERKPFEVF